MDLAPDYILKDRYQIIRQLGKGGMGAVYLAKDNVLDHIVAVKANHSPAREGDTQFLREARLLASLRHPSLPRVTDHFMIGEEQYLVMDYIPGDDLAQILKEDGKQPVEMVMEWAKQLGSAISYLHHQKPPVIHRDIKPANIKLAPSGEVTLVDFGIAKVADPTAATTTGALGFSPGYSPPEQYGGGRTGPYSDQYALAATLYQLLTNHQPEDGLQRLMGTAVLAPANKLNKSVPAYTTAALEKAMSVHPEDRFPDVDTFINAFLEPGVMPEHAAEPTVKSAVKVDSLPPREEEKKKGLPKWVYAAGGLGIIAMAIILYLVFGRSNIPGTTATATSPGETDQIGISVASTLTQRAALAGQPTITPELPTLTLTSEPTATYTPAPTMLGKGGYIAYISNKGDGKTRQVWLMRVALNDIGEVYVVEDRQLTSDPVDKSDPAWSPDGKKLLYAAPSGGQALGIDIWVIDIEKPEDGAINLSQHRGNDYEPAWSPDGSLIVFTNQGAFGTEVKQLYFMNPDGSDIRRVSYDFEEYSPTWSANQLYLAYVISASGRKILYLRSAADNYSSPMKFDTREILGRLGDVANPAWSSDNELLAYTRLEGKSRRIYLTRFEDRGNRITALTDGGKDYDPAWSPDSQWILFTSERDGNPEIYIMNASGALQSNLTLSEGIEVMPAWQPVP